MYISSSSTPTYSSSLSKMSGSLSGSSSGSTSGLAVGLIEGLTLGLGCSAGTGRGFSWLFGTASWLSSGELKQIDCRVANSLTSAIVKNGTLAKKQVPKITTRSHHCLNFHVWRCIPVLINLVNGRPPARRFHRRHVEGPGRARRRHRGRGLHRVGAALSDEAGV